MCLQMFAFEMCLWYFERSASFCKRCEAFRILCVQFLDLCVKIWKKRGKVLENVCKQLKKTVMADTDTVFEIKSLHMTGNTCS